MKTIAACGAVILICLAIMRPVGAENTQQQPQGRFQLMPAEFSGSSVTPDGIPTNFTEKGVFKIDTQTGETWVYFSSMSKTTIMNGWAKIQELPTIPAIGERAPAQSPPQP